MGIHLLDLTYCGQYATLETIWGPTADRIESAAYDFERAQSLADVRDALLRVEALTTLAGWLNFAVYTEKSVRRLGAALAELAPPRVELAVGLGSAGGSLDDDTDWEVSTSWAGAHPRRMRMVAPSQ